MLNETHESLRRIGVSTNEMDQHVQTIQQTKGVLGARMMGGGFGGMILVLVEDENTLPHMDLISPSRPGFVEEHL
jgi:galactokinase